MVLAAPVSHRILLILFPQSLLTSSLSPSLPLFSPHLYLPGPSQQLHPNFLNSSSKVIHLRPCDSLAYSLPWLPIALRIQSMLLSPLLLTLCPSCCVLSRNLLSHAFPCLRDLPSIVMAAWNEDHHFQWSLSLPWSRVNWLLSAPLELHVCLASPHELCPQLDHESLKASICILILFSYHLFRNLYQAPGTVPSTLCKLPHLNSLTAIRGHHHLIYCTDLEAVCLLTNGTPLSTAPGILLVLDKCLLNE